MNFNYFIINKLIIKCIYVKKNSELVINNGAIKIFKFSVIFFLFEFYSFINKDFSAKPWNKSSQFESFIVPKKNESLSFKDQRFNMIFDFSGAILHHLDDIKNYLEQNQHVLNAISIIDRGFLDMEILKPIFCATALMGMHITSPIMAILLDTNTNIL